MKLSALTPGDEVYVGGTSSHAVYIGRCEHPLYKGLQLVIWKMERGWSHDALSLHQDIGDVVPSDAETKLANLRNSLLGAPTW